MHVIKNLTPWTHYIVDDFLTEDCLRELKSIGHYREQITPGQRLGGNRIFIEESNKELYPELYKLYQNLHNGPTKRFFEEQTGLDYTNMFPRVEVISDYGPFYLEDHPDVKEKRLTALVYTDYEQLYPGTMLSDGSRIESKDNRCFFFVPSDNTIHSYPYTVFEKVRRCLQINYWTYQV